MQELPKHLHKYYAKRYSLFSKYDQGILLDDEGWFSVTPEAIAAHIAKRALDSNNQTNSLQKHLNASQKNCYSTQEQFNSTRNQKLRDLIPDYETLKHPIVIDAFCGVGGNSIAFALSGFTVIAIDLSQSRLDLTRNNAQVYGCIQNMHLVCMDYLMFADIAMGVLDVDLVFLSPPWGGVKYKRGGLFDVEEMVPTG